MEHVRRLARFWNWLPAFRAVAETEHLPTAARQFLSSAPALSRAVQLLERDLGHRLFARKGRRIALTDAGREFLARLRNAMRLMDEAVLALDRTTLAGPVIVASSGAVTTAYVLPALDRLRREHRELVPVVLTVTPTETGPRLLRGEIDVAFQSVSIRQPELTTSYLGAIRRGVFCGPAHPLATIATPSAEEVARHDFVGPPPSANGNVEDGWPPELVRTFGMHVDQLRLGCEICASGSHLAVLPDVMASAYGLHRLDLDVIPDDHLFVAHRTELGVATRADTVVAAVRGLLAGEISGW